MGSGISTSKPLGNNNSGVSWQTPLGGSNSFANQAAPYAMLPFSPVAGLAGITGQGVGWSGERFSRNAKSAFGGDMGAWLQHGLNTHTYLQNQKQHALNQANTAGLQGQQYGNAAGLQGGMAAHMNDLGYNGALANYAQTMSQQNAQAQGQAMQGLGALMALIGLL